MLPSVGVFVAHVFLFPLFFLLMFLLTTLTAANFVCSQLCLLPMLSVVNVFCCQCCLMPMVSVANVVYCQCCLLSVLLLPMFSAANVVCCQCCIWPMLSIVNAVCCRCCLLAILSVANVVYCQCCLLPMLSVANVIVWWRRDLCSNRLSCWPSSSSAHLVSSFLHPVHKMSLPIGSCICCLATATRSARECVRLHESIVVWIAPVFTAPEICSSGFTSAPKTKDVCTNYFAHLFSFGSIVVFHLIFFYLCPTHFVTGFLC